MALLLLLLEVEIKEFLGEFLILGEFPDTDGCVGCRHVASGRAGGRHDVIDDLMDRTLGARNQGIVGASRVVGADRVEDHAAFAGIEAHVVVAVVPRQHFLFHGVGVQRLDELVRLDRFRRVDGHGLAVLFHQLAAPAPDNAAQDVIGVFRVAQLDTDRVPLGFQLHADAANIFPGVGHRLADCGEEVGAHGDGEGNEEPRHGAIIALAVPPDDIVRQAAGPPPHLFNQVVQVDQVLLVQIRHADPQCGEVVPLLPLDLAGQNRRKLQVRHAVHAHLDACHLAELFELPLQFLVRRGNKVRERNQAEFAVLADSRGRFCQQHAGDTGRGGQRRTQEAAPISCVAGQTGCLVGRYHTTSPQSLRMMARFAGD